eukprot:Rhum_TRINITY_DN14203_c1_g1::Rhum_TRINITY_DN14203_c1_g1_i1::g.73482::m.73482/K02259/COX15; cytochrome c oxidase assembly protein subunit 15
MRSTLLAAAARSSSSSSLLRRGLAMPGVSSPLASSSMHVRCVGGPLAARWASTVAAGPSSSTLRQVRFSSASAAADTGLMTEHEVINSRSARRMSAWLFVTAGMVFLIVIVGGITRLTESGLSIAQWKPVTGMIPPLNEEQWLAEFEIYKQTPEYAQSEGMGLEQFKGIFFWEWFHRALGRTVGMVYLLPLVGFVAAGTPRRLGVSKRLAFFGFLGGLQGAIGWLMVKSGLEHRNFEDGSKATVSPYRLALHLGTAFVLSLGLTSTAIRIRTGTIVRKGVRPELRPLMPYVHGTLGWVFLTAMTGAAVAGLDAGWIYNEFPYMGEGFVPPTEELFLEKCKEFWPRNLYENPVAAQFTHRVMATTSLLAVSLLSLKARSPLVHAALVGTPAGRALLAVQVLTVWQVSLGVYTLWNHTPIDLAVAHQGSSLLLLTSLVTFQVLLQL